MCLHVEGHKGMLQNQILEPDLLVLKVGLFLWKPAWHLDMIIFKLSISVSFENQNSPCIWQAVDSQKAVSLYGVCQTLKDPTNFPLCNVTLLFTISPRWKFKRNSLIPNHLCCSFCLHFHMPMLTQLCHPIELFSATLSVQCFTHLLFSHLRFRVCPEMVKPHEGPLQKGKALS